jgi:hypothetical protein
MMNYYRFFEKNAFYFLQKNGKKSKKYLTCIFIKIGSSSENFIIKMISAKNSINPESFNGFEPGRPIDMAKIPWIYPAGIWLITFQRIEIKISVFRRLVDRQLVILIHFSKFKN